MSKRAINYNLLHINFKDGNIGIAIEPFMNSVRAYLEDGWHLHGETILIADSRGKLVSASQAFVMYEKEEE